jgi:hypothetical protein
MKHLLMAVACLPAWLATRGAADVVLVQDGQPRAEIVIAEKPPRLVHLAATELQHYAAGLSGASLGIVTRPSGTGLLPVFIGRSVYTDALEVTDAGLEHGAFRIVATEKALVLLGHDADFAPPEPHARDNSDIPRATAAWDKLTGATWGFPHVQVYKGFQPQMKIWELDQGGSLNAVYEILRRLGVRWFMPGEIGEVVPESRTVRLPLGDETIRPDFALRYAYQYSKRYGMASVDETLWQLRLGLSQAPEIIGLSEIGHGTRVVHERPEYRAAHPDHFALFAGKRATEGSFGNGLPCLSSPGLFEQNVRYVRALFDIYNEPSVSVCPEDGYVALCQCDLCQGKGTPERGWNGQISDYVWDYMNRIGIELLKTHPQRKIHCLAYGAYQAPPLKIDRLSPNIIVGIPQARAAFFDPKEKQHYDELRAAWLAKSANPIFIWDYYLYSNPGNTYEFMPAFFPHAIAADLRELRGKSFGDFIEVHRTLAGLQTLAATHLNLYVTSRYWWQADQDIETLLSDYVTGFYGPASAGMRAFVAYAEANWMDLREQPDRIDQAFALLGAAQAQAPADSVYARRMAIIADYMAPLKALREQLSRRRENVPHLQILPNPGAPIVVDGRLTEEVWQRAATFGLLEVQTGRAPVFGSSFQAAWQDDSLIMGITCLDHDTARLSSTTRENEDVGIWNGDVVELLIETQSHSYYQIAISPNGAVTDLDRKGGMNTLWKSGIQVATQRGTPGSWTIELRLPIAGAEQAVLNPLDGVAGRAPSRTYPWYINVCRQRAGDHGTELSAVAPTGTDHFHATDRFAIFNLKPGGTQQDNPSLRPERREGYVLRRQDIVALVAGGKLSAALDACRQLAGGSLTDLQQADVLEIASECALGLKQPDEALALARQIRLPPYARLAEMRVLDARREWQEIGTRFAGEDLAQWPDTLIGAAAAVRGRAGFFMKDGPQAERDLLQAAEWTTDDNVRGESLLTLGSTYQQLLHDQTRAVAAFRRVYGTANVFKQCAAAVAVADILHAQGRDAEARAELARIDERTMTIPFYREMLLKARAALSQNER